jgi:hypothetical protein
VLWQDRVIKKHIPKSSESTPSMRKNCDEAKVFLIAPVSDVSSGAMIGCISSVAPFSNKSKSFSFWISSQVEAATSVAKAPET